MADDSFDGIRPGVYNVDYFSGAQVALYIGDVFVDEVTAINFVAQQQRRPLYGYADQYFRAMSKGQILVQGQFSINFKEAGYMWLILNEYQRKIKGNQDKLDDQPFVSSSQATKQNIEQLINNESINQDQRYSAVASLAEAYATLTGFSSTTRAAGRTSDEVQPGENYGRAIVGKAENIFESFENAVWGKPEEELLNDDRSPDDPDLNPFDIFIMYGDFMGDDRANHTILKLEDCFIIGSSQKVEIDPIPCQEVYSFMGRARI
jgi:hypothetical protein